MFYFVEILGFVHLVINDFTLCGMEVSAAPANDTDALFVSCRGCSEMVTEIQKVDVQEQEAE